jgi:hypothetical protein
LTIVTFLLQRDEAADESDHGVIPLQLDETWGNVTPHRLSQARSLYRADQACGWYLLSEDEARRLVRRLQKPKVGVAATCK